MGQVSLRQGENDYAGAADTYIDLLDPSENFGDADHLQVNADGMAATLLRFDVSTLPDAIQVTEARLRLYTTGREGGSFMVAGIYPMLRPWTVDEATWTLARIDDPWEAAGCEGEGVDRDGTSVHNTMVVAAGEWYEFDVTGLVRRWLLLPDTNHGVLVYSASKEYAESAWASAEYAELAQRPVLIIEYEEVAADPGVRLSLPMILRAG